MTYRGRRENGVDYFDDILGQDDAGALEGLGRADFDRLREKYDQTGLQVNVNCRFCNKGHLLTVEWPELYVIGLNRPGRPPALPQNWQYSQNNGSAFLQLRCSRCHNPGIAVHVTPDEARRHIKKAVDSGLVSQGLLQQLAQRFGQ
jgi:phage FluMu protein Com